MKIYNGTNSSLNIPMANKSRLLIGPMSASTAFYPSVEVLELLVSAYSRDDIAIVIESSAELQMGSLVSALPGYVVNSVEEAVMKFKKPEPKKVEKPKAPEEPKEETKVKVEKKAEAKNLDDKLSK